RNRSWSPHGVLFLTFVGFLLAGCGGNQTDKVSNRVPSESRTDVKNPAGGPELTLSHSPRKNGKSVQNQLSTEGSDWPQFLGPFGTSVSAEKGIINPWPAEGLRLVWQKLVGTGYAMPSVSRGRLYLFDREGDRARLSCLYPGTGELIWKFDYPTDYEDYYGYNNGPRCCPVVDGDRVYIYGPEGMLHCLNAADGQLIWKLDTQSEFHVVQNFFGVGSAPVIEGDLLIVQVGGSLKGDNNEGPQKGNGSGVVCFDKLTGKVRYKISDELASYSSPTLATINGRRWCFVLARGGLIAFDPVTGKIDFHFPWRARAFESVNASNPVVVDDRVFISECYGPGSALLRVKEGGYEILWTDADKRFDKSMRCHWNTPIVHDGYLYGSSGRHTHEAELRCIELATGKVMWSQPDLTRSSLLMADGHFSCLTEDGKLLLLSVNPKKYEEISRMELHKQGEPESSLLRPPCWAAPILSHGLLFVRGHDKLLCFQLIAKK
ncbi:MAG TPA: PQQ-binding-like beta-propeller repeat protein, partial [Gemmataceae bacterium]|nr:PQQ-binding-like beta-propeller repeat protein [Gemmataceae bacterium]